MGLISTAIQNITKAPRLPVTQSRSQGTVIFGGDSISDSSNRSQQLGQMTSSAWLFAIIDRISTAVARTEWRLFQERRLDRQELLEHFLLDLWNSPNPFYTRPEFLMTLVNHYNLVGEMWIVKVRDNLFGLPMELQPVRPDRIRPIPSHDDFLSGYIYQIGSERIPLAIEDVIFVRRPSPINPYRGIGQIGALLFELGAERQASQWTANFFRNSAMPGGIIQMDEEMSDDDFDKFVMRWRQQHQGVQNSHRVAVIERGKWVDRSFSMRDLTFPDLRRTHRDIILGAYGMPASILGVAENVNRANAEAAEVLFARWIVAPILELLRSALNERLAKEIDTTLKFDFVDPVPDNREIDMREGVAGYRSGILTRNEARRRFDEDDVPEGDEFLPTPSGGGAGLLAAAREAVVKQDNPLRPEDVNTEEDAILRGWRKRLGDEAEALASFLDQFKAMQKLEPSDVDGYDWNWWAKYGDDVIAELVEAFSMSMLSEFPDAAPGVVQLRASEWATERAGQLIRLDGEINVVAQTRERVREIISTGVNEGQGLGQIQKALRDDFAFSPTRAARIARTETATALGQGAKGAALAQGRNEKRWITQADDRVNQPICAANESQGWIKLADPFQSGHDTIPGHIQCRCNVRYRTRVEEVRCPRCDAVLAKDMTGSVELKCRRCKEVVRVTA